MLRIQIRNGKEHLQQCVNTLGKQKFWEDIPVVFESDYEGDERMDDKDQKAFEKWFESDRGVIESHHENQMISATQRDLYRWEQKAWQAACEYKQKEIDELKYCSEVFYEATKR